MSKPKFEVGEVVRVTYSDGSVFAESAMIIEHLILKDHPMKCLCSGSRYPVTGLRYRIDIESPDGRGMLADESLLSRIPPPKKSWEQLRAELNQPSSKELS